MLPSSPSPRPPQKGPWPTDVSGRQWPAPLRCMLLLSLVAAGSAKGATTAYVPPPLVSPATGQPPLFSPATGHVNRIYKWRSQKMRYQVVGENNPGPSLILIHGMFVNCDHWRHTMGDLANAGCRVFALDLLGFGYSSKPPPSDSDVADFVNGENRFELDSTVSGLPKISPILRNVKLGTATGGIRIRDMSLRHPLGSIYNFYTWAEQIEDFTRNIVLVEADNINSEKVTLIGNSIGSIAAMQATMDCPDLFNGVFVLTPTFRSKHHAEVPCPWLSMPILTAVQKFLRTKGHNLYQHLAKPSTVKKLLQKPYAVNKAVDDDLVDALLTPLRLPGASDVILDILSYSAGPLPEQQLAVFPRNVPVWIAYGTADPWTPGKRVESMARFDNVEKIIRLEGIGHCPHDEAPEVVNPLLLEFVDRVNS